MKKTTLLILMLFITTLSFAQVLNEPANWPNSTWTITGTYSTNGANFEANPTVDSNFAYDDNQNGFGLMSQIAAESPVIDLTPTFNAGEFWITVEAMYVYNEQTLDDLGFQYWDADAATWVNWGPFINADTPGVGIDNFCNSPTQQFVSEILDIASFTPTQLSGFKYRIYFNDNGGWVKGFCFSSPTIYSDGPPACPDFDISEIAVGTITPTSVDITWAAGGSETNWEVVVQPAGTGTPTLGVGIPVSPTPATTVPGLNPNSAYEIYIISDCGGGDYSSWIGPVTFNTPQLPPPAPDGVTCPTSSFIFTEDFDEPGFWTGDINTGGGSWEIPDGSTSTGTGANTAYSGNNYMNFEASGASGVTAAIVSPAIDLNGANGEIELSFYMHAYGLGMGTLNVGVSNSPTGPFNNVFNWTGQYQTSGAQAWAPVGIDLTAYANQIIYLEFSQTAMFGGAYGSGDMSIDYLRVEACGDFCIAPSVFTLDDITDTTADISWTPNNGETSWYYVVQPAGTGTPTGTGTQITGASSIDLSNLIPDTDYEIYIMSDCGSGFNSIWSNPFSFTTLIQTEFIVDCSVGPTIVNYCYGNNDTTTFTFTSIDGITPIGIFFEAGTMQAGSDQVTVTDAIGTVLYTGSGTGGNLTGFEFQATTTTVNVSISSDGSNSCVGGQQSSPLEIRAYCITCFNHDAEFNIVNDCQNGQYYVDVDITDMGDATSLTITDDQGSPSQVATALGITTFGPYALGTNVHITVANTNDANCTLTSPNLNQSDCPTMLVSNTEYTVPELVTDVLINSDCAIVNNFNWSTDANSIGYFYDAYNFSFQDGVILSSGNIFNAPGPNTTAQNYSSGTGGDADLSAITGENDLNDAAFIEFDFIPLIDTMSFDFLFASKEYTANFECTYSDAFAFILTDAAGNVSNLAVIPGTTIPVTVINIHGGIGSCGPANPTYFDQYNGTGGEINFEGQTVVMTASSTVVPGDTYHIKLVIADALDSSLDSAVFLGANSFNIGDVDLGDDITIVGGTAQCGDTPYTLDAGSIPANSSIAWYLDGVLIPGETSTTLTATETGVYTAEITYNNTLCSYSGSVLVEFYPIPELEFDDTTFENEACEDTTLTVNHINIADAIGNITYSWYDSTGVLVQEGTSDSYVLLAGQAQEGTFTVTAIDDANNCQGSASVDVIIVGSVTAYQAGDLEACDDISNDGYVEFDLSQQDEVIINGQPNVAVTYHRTPEDATADVNPLSSTYTNEDAYVQTIYARAAEANADGCFEVTSFDLLVYNTPILLFENYYEVCSNGIDPVMLVGNNSGFELDDPGVTFAWTWNGDALTEDSNVLEIYDAGTYTVEVNTENCSNFYELIVREAGNCIIPQGISPNGDTMNQSFDLDGFNIAHISIFNRLGKEVYTKTDYKDEWHGQTDNGDELPVGTYFYVLKQDNGNTITGWVYVNRSN